MENRRPPRSNSFGRKPYFDRGRGAPFRSTRPASDGAASESKQTDRAGDGRYQKRSSRGDGQPGQNPRFGGGGKNRQPDRFGKSPYDHRPGHNKNRPPRPGKSLPVEDQIKITSDAQVTDGKLRGRELRNSNSPNSVPTKRKLREIVFKVISRRVRAARVLDLGAGAGTIGIESISRGAMLATFVERSARMCTFLRQNLSELGIKNGHSEVVEMEILPFLTKTARRKRLWELVYLDLRGGNEQAAIVDLLSRGRSLTKGGLLMIEHSSDTSHPDQFGELRRWRTIDQGETILSIYERI